MKVGLDYYIYDRCSMGNISMWFDKDGTRQIKMNYEQRVLMGHCIGRTKRDGYGSFADGDARR